MNTNGGDIKTSSVGTAIVLFTLIISLYIQDKVLAFRSWKGRLKEILVL